RALPNKSLDAPFAGRANVTVARADVEDVRLAVNRGFALYGFVEMDDGSAVPDLAVRMPTGDGTLEFGFLSLFDVERGSFADLQSNPTRGDGTFRIERIPPGKYQLMNQRLPQRFYIKSIWHGGQEIGSSPLDLTYGSIENARVVIGTKAGQVSA